MSALSYLAKILSKPMFLPLARWVYPLIANHRYKLSKLLLGEGKQGSGKDTDYLPRMSQPSNFDFLKSEFPDFAKAAMLAERAVYPDPHGACFHCRRALEIVVHWLYKVDNSLSQPYDNTLGHCSMSQAFRTSYQRQSFRKQDYYKRLVTKQYMATSHLSNYGAADGQRAASHPVLGARTYTRLGAAKLHGITFDTKLIPSLSRPQIG
ncbi:hypothetical protein [Rubritalea tangerina]|uniref:hypothetical protein n=1 Tax=Rubritalea tangerina TaxID=430798 RepID=UPI003616FD70